MDVRNGGLVGRGDLVGFLDTLRGMFTRPYGTVRPADVAEVLKRGGVLLDVREPAEWRAGHAPKARHIPLGQLAARAGELPSGRPVVTVCRSGMRSARAAGLLAADGREVLNLGGGMRAWAAAGLPVVTNGGRPGTVA
jgi:rhodanese-related sulfurtransferase